MAEQPGAGVPPQDELDYAGGGLAQETNWWGAFVIGLAGTILVTGIAPVMVTTLGAASIPLIVAITLTGYLLCLLLAELSAMMPERTGGAPSYAYPAYKDRWPRLGAPHQRRRPLGVLARLVPRRAAEHDPGVVLHRGSLRARHDLGLHAHRHLHRLVDRSPSPSWASSCSSSRPTSGSGSGRASPRCSAHLDDPADLPGGRVRSSPGTPTGASSRTSSSSTARLLHRPAAATGGSPSTSPTRSC